MRWNGRRPEFRSACGPHILRVAISNNRILKLADDQVTFGYKDANTGKNRHCTVAAEEFIRRSLRVQHVPPKGLVKVRYYGFFSHSKRHLLHRIRQLLQQRRFPSQISKDRLLLLKSYQVSRLRRTAACWLAPLNSKRSRRLQAPA